MAGNILWRATLHWRNTVSGLFAQNVLHFEENNAVPLTADQIGAIIDNDFWGSGTTQDFLRQYTCSHVVLQLISLQQLFPGPPLGTIPYVTQQRPGHQGGFVKHPVLGYVFTLKDGFAGKKHRGRIYHYGAIPNHLTDAGPTSSLMLPANIPSMIARWMVNFGPNSVHNLHLAIHHRGELGLGLWDRVTNIQLAPRCCVQRRRNHGVGI